MWLVSISKIDFFSLFNLSGINFNPWDFCCCNFKLQIRRQTEALLKQDKEYLNKQLQELRGRCTLAEERLEQMSQQLGETKQAREELYEKYISVREQYKSEYELRLKSELDDIKGKTSLELDRIRGDTKDMFERENRWVGHFVSY